jgi:hypothetical protein
MRLNPRITRLIENVFVAAMTAVVILVWEPTMFVGLPKLPDEDELAAYRFILDNPPPSPVQLRRLGVAAR